MDHSSLLPLVDDRDQAPSHDSSRGLRPRAIAECESIHIECVDAASLEGWQVAWADLCTRAIEPNIFLEPGFALPLLESMPRAARPSVLMVWAENGPAAFGRLIGLFPMLLPNRPWFGRVARNFTHEQTSCGTPLVDRDLAPHVLAAILDWLGDNGTRLDAMVLAGLAKDGPFYDVLLRVCADSARRFVSLEDRGRAVLRRSDGLDQRMRALTSPKRRKERARQIRRLSETGTRTYTQAKTTCELATATKRFLALEHNGWKGARGTALLADPALAAFTRVMTQSMGADGKCRIDAIEIDGRPVAMGIVLRAADRAYFWKTAFDEAYAPLSPGVQFALELTQVQLSDPAVAATDSCAIANHPMIDRLWPDRATVADVMIAVSPGNGLGFRRSLAIETLRRAARTRAKGLWLRVRRFLRHRT